MKIQQTTSHFASPHKFVAAPQSDITGKPDTVTLGNQASDLETDMGRMYSAYRFSNSQYDQNYLKREMLTRLDSCSGFVPTKGKLQELLTRLFDKNDRAWSLREQQSKPRPKTELEFNFAKHDAAKGQPLCGDNLFHQGEWQRRKNLLPILQPQHEKCGSVVDVIERDLTLGQNSSKKKMGSVADEIRRDLNLLQAKPGENSHQNFQAHLFNRLA